MKTVVTLNIESDYPDITFEDCAPSVDTQNAEISIVDSDMGNQAVYDFSKVKKIVFYTE